MSERSEIADALNKWWMESGVPDDGSVSEALQELDWLTHENKRLTGALATALSVFLKYSAGFAYDAEQAREMAIATQNAVSPNPCDIEGEIRRLRESRAAMSTDLGATP